MAKIGRICKEYMVKELTDKLKGNSSIFITNYTGLTVLDLGKLRVNLNQNKASYVVSKNSLTKIALEGADIKDLVPLIDGSVGLVLGGADPISVSKTLSDFSKGSDKLKVLGGILDGKLISEADIKTLSALPPKNILLARAFGGMKAPISNFVTVLGETINKFVYAINAIKEKVEKEVKEKAPEPKEEPKPPSTEAEKPQESKDVEQKPAPEAKAPSAEEGKPEQKPEDKAQEPSPEVKEKPEGEVQKPQPEAKPPSAEEKKPEDKGPTSEGTQESK